MEDEQPLVDFDHPELVLRPPIAPFADLLPIIRQQVQEQKRAGNPTIASIWICMSLSQRSRVSAMRTFKRWLTRKIAGPFDHIEILVVLSNGHCRPYTVDQYDPHPRKRGSGFVRRPVIDPTEAYSPSRWVTCQLASFDEYESAGISYFLERQLGKPMNSTAMYWNFILPFCIGMPLEYEQDSYFCSHLVAAALKWVRPDQFEDLNPLKCTPHKLYKLLRQGGDIDHPTRPHETQMVVWRKLDDSATF